MYMYIHMYIYVYIHTYTLGAPNKMPYDSGAHASSKATQFQTSRSA